jgi:hypothetical protein
MAASQILLISNKRDTTADLVVLAAERHGIPIFRLNTEDLPDVRTKCSPAQTEFAFEHSRGRFVITKGTGICYRRPSPPETSETIHIGQWMADQWQDFILGIEATDDLRWISRPSSLRRAESKIYQMKLARAVGFKIPATLITNDFDAFLSFSKIHPQLICKALGGGLVGDEEQGSFIYTTSIGSDVFPNAEDLRLAPVMFQENLAPAEHYRVTVVGSSAIPVRLTFDEAVLDWRTLRDPPRVEPAELSMKLNSAAVALVQSAGLAFSSMDLMVREGDVYFLDLNPGGEWAWLERNAGVRIADEIVGYLAGAICP